MTERTLINYPRYIADLGGAAYAFIGVRVAHVTLGDGRTIKMPAKLAIGASEQGGMALGAAAEQWARRQAGERCAIHGFTDDGALSKPCPACERS